MSETPRKAPRKSRALAVQPPRLEPVNGAGDPAPTNLLAVVAHAARDPACDVQKMQALLDMMERLERRDAERAYNRAFAAMSAQLPQIERLGTVDTGKGTYAFAKREDQDAAIRPLMAEFGFAVQFRILEENNNLVRVEGVLMHVDGHHSEPSVFTAAPDTGPGRNPTQARGSAISYAERYIIEGLLNLVRKGSDDDGRGGGRRDPPLDGNREQAKVEQKRERERYTTDPKSWLGKAERKLDQVAEDGWQWLRVLQYAAKTAPDNDSLTALEGMTREVLKGDKTPQQVRDDAAAAFLTARLRLSNERAKAEGKLTDAEKANVAAAATPFYLVDPWGEVIGEFTDPVLFVNRLVEHWGKITDEQVASQLLENNEEHIERAQADKSAAEILKVLDEPILPPDPDDAWADQAILKFEAAKDRDEFVAAFEWSKQTMLRLRKAKPDIFDRVDQVVARVHKALPE